MAAVAKNGRAPGGRLQKPALALTPSGRVAHSNTRVWLKTEHPPPGT
jgi:hypothetical protein